VCIVRATISTRPRYSWPAPIRVAMAVAQKRTLYVGNLDPATDEGLLRAAFVPFGEVTEVNMAPNFAGNFFRDIPCCVC